MIAQEMSNEEARSDRGLVKEINISKIEEIKKLVLSGRDKNNKTMDAERGRAIERMIPRLDRVGFFLLGHKNKPLVKPPTWLLTHVNDTWEKVGKWVEYRQNKENDNEFYHKNYGVYLQKLENYRIKHKL